MQRLTPSPTQQPAPSARPSLIVCLHALLIAVLLSACNPAAPAGPTPTPDPCGPSEIARYKDAIDGVSRRFSDAFTVASNAPRMSLPPVIQDLQAIRRDAEDLDVPACAAPAKAKLVAYMNAVIDAFNAFMSQKSDRYVSTLFEAATKLLEEYSIEIGRLVGISPEASPTPAK